MVSRATLLALIVGATACASTRSPEPWSYSPRPLADTLAIWEPDERKSAFIYDIAYQALIRGQGASGKDAWNLTPADDVVASTWFTPRLGYEGLTPEDLARGPRTTEGPDTSAPLEVWSIKAEGVTPGFWVKDASDARWIVKFDPPGNPELTSGANVVANHLFWAAGYNTPEDRIFDLDPETLVLDPDLGMTMEAFRRNFIDIYPRQSDGTLRTLVSKFLPGAPKGPFDYEGTRDDDPNDVIRHEFRRELRGLYTVGAWLNHIDIRQGNTLDIFVEHPNSPSDGRKFGYLRHYLIDFGATLGSASIFAHNRRHGTEYDLDKGAIGKRFITLGLYSRPWEHLPEGDYPPTIGYYSADNYDPGDWRPNFPNPAFDQALPGDAYWGAKIVAAFTDAHLRAAVDLGEYSDPADADLLFNALRDRRDATVRYWYGKVTPLERIRIENGAVIFDDLWQARYDGTSEYRFAFEWEAYDLVRQDTVGERRIELPMPSGPPSDGGAAPYGRLEIWRRTTGESWSPNPVTVWLAWDPTARSYQVSAVRH